MRGAIAQSHQSSESETTAREKYGGKIMSPCGRNANQWRGCFSVFTRGFYPNFSPDYYSPPVTAKVTFLPVLQGNLRPTFLLHYERKFFVAPAYGSLQSSRGFHADYEGGGTEPWKTTLGLQ